MTLNSYHSHLSYQQDNQTPPMWNECHLPSRLCQHMSSRLNATYSVVKCRHGVQGAKLVIIPVCSQNHWWLLRVQLPLCGTCKPKKLIGWVIGQNVAEKLEQAMRDVGVGTFYLREEGNTQGTSTFKWKSLSDNTTWEAR
ncbi:uncharacterized protein LOC144880007 [Branchiostoma floridae x Branchiostoma japonicum]